MSKISCPNDAIPILNRYYQTIEELATCFSYFGNDNHLHDFMDRGGYMMHNLINQNFWAARQIVDNLKLGMSITVEKFQDVYTKPPFDRMHRDFESLCYFFLHTLLPWFEKICPVKFSSVQEEPIPRAIVKRATPQAGESPDFDVLKYLCSKMENGDTDIGALLSKYENKNVLTVRCLTEIVTAFEEKFSGPMLRSSLSLPYDKIDIQQFWNFREKMLSKGVLHDHLSLWVFNNKIYEWYQRAQYFGYPRPTEYFEKFLPKHVSEQFYDHMRSDAQFCLMCSAGLLHCHKFPHTTCMTEENCTYSELLQVGISLRTSFTRSTFLGLKYVNQHLSIDAIADYVHEIFPAIDKSLFIDVFKILDAGYGFTPVEGRSADVVPEDDFVFSARSIRHDFIRASFETTCIRLRKLGIIQPRILYFLALALSGHTTLARHLAYADPVRYAEFARTKDPTYLTDAYFHQDIPFVQHVIDYVFLQYRSGLPVNIQIMLQKIRTYFPVEKYADNISTLCEQLMSVDLCDRYYSSEGEFESADFMASSD